MGQQLVVTKKSDLIDKATQLLDEHDAVFEALVSAYSSLSPINHKVLLKFGEEFFQFSPFKILKIQKRRC